MNILIPHSWLLEHLETNASPTEIQKHVSLCGPSIERIYEREGEAVYDIEVTTNRVDSMSVRGIAREVAVILQQFGIPAQLKDLQLPDSSSFQPTQNLPLPKINNDPSLCKRTLGIILSNVKRTPTPEWMAKRLRQTDQNIHDSVIDITNYITHELGHPCHAFDYDKVMKLGGEINIVEAKAGEKFMTLDGIAYEAVGGEVVFKNQTGEIIDLPAIKGTANSSIDESTTNVLLWIESLDAKKVRFASMTHAIRTVAAQLSEKNVDPELALPVLLRGIELYQQLCQANIASLLHDDFPGKKQLTAVEISLQEIKNYLGLSLPLNKITTILNDLECQVDVNAQAEKLTITPPTFRPDLVIPADIVEEIARIYGYHNLPSVLMPTAIPLVKPTGTNFHLESKLKHFLADVGWQEVYTYSMVSEELALKTGYSLKDHLKIQNELTEDKVYLRRSLLPSLVEILNQNPHEENLSVFEVANLYHPKTNDIPDNETHLALVSRKSYRQVRGDVEALLDRLFIKQYEVEPSETPSSLFNQEAIINAEGEKIGEIGILKEGLVAVTLPLAALIKVARSHPEYQPIPKTSLISEDLTFNLSQDVQVGKILRTMKVVSPLINAVTLKDIYQNNFTFNVSYLDPEKNLSAEDVSPLRKQIVDTVTKDFSATLVGSI